MYIPHETLDLIRNRVVIQDVIKRYVPSLKKTGRNYTGLCPFHKEKTPSFSVSPDKQMFYCFGCHLGGNIFSFISKIERLEFPESVKFVADIVGVEIKGLEKGDATLLESIHRLNGRVMEMYHRYIKSPPGKKGLAYISARGITPESVDRFKIGYAPDSWDFLVREALKTKSEIDLAESIGLIKKGKKRENSHYDLFRNRIMFPIFDIHGAVIAFGGRALGDDPRKYLNSPESEAFKKRNVLYGLHRAKESIRELNRAIVVEGYLDVIGCHQAGIENVVAPLGTAITAEQIRMLGHYCTDIIFLYDADSAGLQAGIRSLEISDETNIQVRIGMLPEGDPFDFITSRGPKELMIVVDRALKPVDFKIERIMENHGKAGRVATLIQLFGVIRDLPMETERSVYLKKTSTLLGLDENSIRTDFKSFLSKGKSHVIENEHSTENDQADSITRSYRDLIGLICRYPELIEKAVIDYNINEIPDSISRNVIRKLSELYFSDQNFSTDKIFDFFQTGPEMDFLNQVFHSEHSVANPGAAYTEIYINMKVREIDDKIYRYASKIKSASNGNFHEYISEIEVLRREKEKLCQYIYNKFV